MITMSTLIILQIYILAFITLIFILTKLIKAEKLKFRKSKTDIQKTVNDLPSVSVCIAVRNEVDSMTPCLESVLASDYPKLEVLVLDDNSTDNTSHIVRAFAHAGVRFISGEEPPEGWLGRNYALENLSEEASGQYVIFLDVDARLKPDTISQMVSKYMDDDVSMMTFIPQRADVGHPSMWFGTLRYFWEIIFHSKRKPSASSSVWIINRHILREKLGGFGRWRDQIQPELEIAKTLKSSDCELVISTPDLGITYEKKWSSQISTSRRILLPRFGNSIFNTVVGAGLLAIVVLPQIVFISSIISGWNIGYWGAVIIGFVAAVASLMYYRLVWAQKWIFSPIISVYVAWQELFVLLSSIDGYTRGTVAWKDRSINRPDR